MPLVAGRLWRSSWMERIDRNDGIGGRRMAKFCKFCGSAIDANTGLCPKCHAVQLRKRQEQNSAPEESKKSSSEQERRNPATGGKNLRRRTVKFMVLIPLLLILAAGAAAALVYFNIYEVPIISDILQFNGTTSARDDLLADNVDELAEINLGEETRSRCDVLETIEAADSAQTTSEADTAALFQERGFDASEVTAMYSMDGTYTGDMAVDADSETEHPLYNLIYVSGEEYLWMVYCCNGEFSAYPISYVLSETAACEILVSETEYIMSYDSQTNCYYRMIPNENECVILQVSHIDRDTLDALASGELGVS